MDILKGNLLYGQSGGPTSVINSSAYGVIKEALANTDTIENVLLLRHGISGVLEENFVNVLDVTSDIELLKLSNDLFNVIIVRPPMIYGIKGAPGNMQKLINFVLISNILIFFSNNPSLDISNLYNHGKFSGFTLKLPYKFIVPFLTTSSSFI